MKNIIEANFLALEKIATVTPLTYPLSAYLDFAENQGEAITNKLIAKVDNSYYARFNTEAEFLEALTNDFGYLAPKTLEQAYNDYIVINNRYYSK